ncbi:hypothetical protein [Leptolyngbya sp. FACHB-261]|uniref:hypothetical protein n=1 Tax=Leptolyngbya sp. FACHB-261 TaxID=2692806 RepID=UPI001689F4E8|nr:hypothetical protein [Leptolyngbya sp. FACHB-261]MBD2103228.1 hypothetical protein [Leptolyngbya sp. FACHB-261]
MSYNVLQLLYRQIASLAVALALGQMALAQMAPAAAQVSPAPLSTNLSTGTTTGSYTLPDCQLPGVAGALLLVLRSDYTALSQVQPLFAGATPCSYYNQTATRLGYMDLERANQWANYLGSTYDLPALVVAAPSNSSQEVTVVQRTNTQTGNNLFARYLVLIDPRGNGNALPLLRQNTGLDAQYILYGQQTLIAAYGTNIAAQANQTSAELRRRGFEANVLDRQLSTSQPLRVTQIASRPIGSAANYSNSRLPGRTNQRANSSPVSLSSQGSQGTNRSRSEQERRVIYRILIPRYNPGTLGQVQKLAPDAFERVVNDQPFIQAASYLDRDTAERNRSQWLENNFPGTLIEAARD